MLAAASIDQFSLRSSRDFGTTDYQQTVNQSMLLQPKPFPKIIALCLRANFAIVRIDVKIGIPKPN